MSHLSIAKGYVHSVQSKLGKISFGNKLAFLQVPQHLIIATCKVVVAHCLGKTHGVITVQGPLSTSPSLNVNVYKCMTAAHIMIMHL